MFASDLSSAGAGAGAGISCGSGALVTFLVEAFGVSTAESGEAELMEELFFFSRVALITSCYF